MALFKNCVQKVIASNLQFQQLRFYPRWSHRQPAKVLDPKEYENIERQHLDGKEKIVTKSSSLNTNKHYNRSVSDVDPLTMKLQQKDIDDNEHIAYKIDLKQIKKVKLRVPNTSNVKSTTDMLEAAIDKDGNYVYTKMKNKDLRITDIFMKVKSRKSKDLMLLEGKRLIQEALVANCKLEYLLFSRKTDLDSLNTFLPKIGCKLYKMPYKEMQMWSDLSTSPGVMGIFKVPDLKVKPLKNSLPLTVICDNIREPGNLGAILRASAAVGCKKVVLTKGCTYLWDMKVLRSACGSHFKLSVESKTDWSNIQESIDKDANVFIADNNVLMQDANKTTSSVSNLSELVSSVPVVPYYSIDYTEYRDIVLIVGGESEGISADAYTFAMERQGARVNVPLSNQIESLNAGTALGIISFEIKRQLTLKKSNFVNN